MSENEKIRNDEQSVIEKKIFDNKFGALASLNALSFYAAKREYDTQSPMFSFWQKIVEATCYLSKGVIKQGDQIYICGSVQVPSARAVFQNVEFFSPKIEDYVPPPQPKKLPMTPVGAA